MSKNKQIAQLSSTIWTLCLLKVDFEPQTLPLFPSTTKCTLHSMNLLNYSFVFSIMTTFLKWKHRQFMQLNPYTWEKYQEYHKKRHLISFVIAFFFHENNERRQFVKTSSLQYYHGIQKNAEFIMRLHRIKFISILKHFTERISNMIYCFHVKTPSVNGQTVILSA